MTNLSIHFADRLRHQSEGASLSTSGVADAALHADKGHGASLPMGLQKLRWSSESTQIEAMPAAERLDGTPLSRQAALSFVNGTKRATPQLPQIRIGLPHVA